MYCSACRLWLFPDISVSLWLCRSGAGILSVNAAQVSRIISEVHQMAESKQER